MFEQIIQKRLQADRERVAAAYRGEEVLEAPLIHCQGTALEQFRLPEYFRGNPGAGTAFLGPHAPLLPDEPAPLYGETSAEEYCSFYTSQFPARVPFSHYDAIAGEGAWLALELPPWKAPKDLVLSLLKGKATGPELAGRSLELIWALLAATPVRTLVITGAETMKWTWPALGLAGKPPSATQGHGQVWGEFDLPGAPGRRLKVVTSFHWGPEVPLFVRKVPGLGAMSPREAIRSAREAIAATL